MAINKILKLSGELLLGTLSADPSGPLNGMMYYNSTTNTIRQYANGAWGTVANGTVTPIFLDGSFEIENTADNTKIITMDASGITTGNTRSLKMADANVDLANLTNSNISASAAIAFSKMAALSNSVVPVTNGSGVITSSAVTATTLGYLDATSSIQTQLNTKAPTASPTFTGTPAAPTASPGTNTTQVATTAFVAAATAAVAVTGSTSILDTSGTLTVIADPAGALNLGASGVAVKVDNTTINISGDQLAIKNNSVTSTQIDTTLYADMILGDGTHTYTANQPMGTHKLTGLAAGTTAGDSVRYEQAVLVNGVNGFTANQDMGGNKLTGLANGSSANDAVNYSQLTAISTGLNWLASINDPDLVNDSLNTPPGSPVYSITYIIAASPTGAWTGLAGHAVWWDGAHWIDISTNAAAASGFGTAVQVGDRFAVAIGTAGASAYLGGGLTGKANYIVQIASNTPGSITYTNTTPVVNYAVNVSDTGSQHYGSSFTYNGNTNTWVDFSGPAKVVAGNALSYNGNTLNVNYDNVTLDLTSNTLEVKAGGISNTQIATGAAIAYSKLNLTGDVVNSDISTSAAIAYSKLNLTGDVVNTDISATAAIAYSKLNLTGSVVNADINASAAIARTKLAAGTAYDWVTNDGSGNMSQTAVTASKAVVTDANGLPSASATTATQVGYLSTTTSDVQVQINGKIASVSADTNPSLGGNLSLNGHSIASPLQVGTDTRFFEEDYVDNVTLTASSSNTVLSNLTFAYGTYIAIIVDYSIREATTNSTRVGRLRVVSDGGTNIGISDDYADTVDVGTTWSAAYSGSNVQINYTTTANNKTFKAKVTKLLV